MAVGAYFKSAQDAVIAFLSGVLIDADHLLDYAMSHKFSLDLRKIYDACSEVQLTRMPLVLHSYEFVIAVWLAITLFSLNSGWVAFAAGITQHLIIDQIYNPVKPLSYFFIYRLARNFDAERLIDKGRLKNRCQ